MDSGQARLWIPVLGRSEQPFLVSCLSCGVLQNPTLCPSFLRVFVDISIECSNSFFRGWNRVEDVLGVLARRWDGLVRGWVLVMSSDGSGSAIQRAWDVKSASG